jgi:hypothetical protein
MQLLVIVSPSRLVKHVKIAFLCGCLETGRDGVGDYTRRLACELIRQGHQASIIALNDPHVQDGMYKDKTELGGKGFDFQTSDGTQVSVLRLSWESTWSERMQLAKQFIDSYDPDCLSLQFVPYSFHPKGLPFRLPGRLKTLAAGRKWHVMFHELCLGLQMGSPLKDRVVGRLQKSIILRVLGKIRVSVTHSQCAPYVHVLNQWGVPATQLQLFPNLPVCSETSCDSLYQIRRDLPHRDQMLIAGIFGSVHARWPAERVLGEFRESAARRNKQAVFLMIGNSHLSEERISALKERFQSHVEILVSGHRLASEVSGLLQSLDLGFASSPWDLIDKSGSASAMREHRVPVVVPRDDWKLPGSIRFYCGFGKIRDEGDLRCRTKNYISRYLD